MKVAQSNKIQDKVFRLRMKEEERKLNQKEKKNGKCDGQIER